MSIVINSISLLNIQKEEKVTLKHLLLTFWLLPRHAFHFPLCAATYYFKEVIMFIFLLWRYFRSLFPTFSLSALPVVPANISVRYPIHTIHNLLHKQA